MFMSARDKDDKHFDFDVNDGDMTSVGTLERNTIALTAEEQE